MADSQDTPTLPEPRIRSMLDARDKLAVAHHRMRCVFMAAADSSVGQPAANAIQPVAGAAIDTLDAVEKFLGNHARVAANG